jgi:hypothetical protein
MLISEIRVLKNLMTSLQMDSINVFAYSFHKKKYFTIIKCFKNIIKYNFKQNVLGQKYILSHYIRTKLFGQTLASRQKPSTDEPIPVQSADGSRAFKNKKKLSGQNIKMIFFQSSEPQN